MLIKSSRARDVKNVTHTLASSELMQRSKKARR
jgi:hypothetical protein